MPFIVVKRDSQYCVYTQDDSGDPTGEAHGCHPTREAAVQQLRALYANVPEARKDAAQMITLGPAVKAMGDGKISGYLVTWGDEATKDAEGEWFTRDTDFDTEFPARASVYYHHGQDPAIGRQRLTHGAMEADDFGVRIDAQLNIRDPKQAAIYRRVEKGELGWSSGSLSHITIPPREAPGGPIRQWPLGHDASLTWIPSDRRNLAVAMKSAALPALEELLDEGARPSLVTDTDCALDAATAACARLDVVLPGYRVIAEKSAQRLSSARRARLAELEEAFAKGLEAIRALLAETAPRDAAAATPSSSPPAMGEGADTQPAAGFTVPTAALPDLHDVYLAACRQFDQVASLPTGA